MCIRLRLRRAQPRPWRDHDLLHGYHASHNTPQEFAQAAIGVDRF